MMKKKKHIPDVTYNDDDDVLCYLYSNDNI